jgi:hypothetical protein
MESFEEGASEPSPQTIRDRLNLDGSWYKYFHQCMWYAALQLVKRFQRWNWSISIDEKYIAFFGDRKKLNKKLVAEGNGKLVHGYTNKTPGATGSFCFLVISLSCKGLRIPISIKMVAVKESYKPWLHTQIRKLLQLVPKAVVLADRGFGKATWFHRMLDELKAKRIIRIPLRAKRLKKKVERKQKRFQYWMTNNETREKALLNVRVVYDTEDKVYIFATTEDKKSSAALLQSYLKRWDIENLFKDADRVWLPTSSRNPLMRLFEVVLAFFLFALWQIKRLKKGCDSISIRSFVKKIIETCSKICRCTITVMGCIVHTPP